MNDHIISHLYTLPQSYFNDFTKFLYFHPIATKHISQVVDTTRRSLLTLMNSSTTFLVILYNLLIYLQHIVLNVDQIISQMYTLPWMYHISIFPPHSNQTYFPCCWYYPQKTLDTDEFQYDIFFYPQTYPNRTQGIQQIPPTCTHPRFSRGLPIPVIFLLAVNRAVPRERKKLNSCNP